MMQKFWSSCRDLSQTRFSNKCHFLQSFKKVACRIYWKKDIVFFSLIFYKGTSTKVTQHNGFVNRACRKLKRRIKKGENGLLSPTQECEWQTSQKIETSLSENITEGFFSCSQDTFEKCKGPSVLLNMLSDFWIKQHLIKIPPIFSIFGVVIFFG